MGRFRILFVSDLHGSEVCFRKFLNSTAVYHPDVLVYGGDIMGKMLVPIFPEDGGGYRWFPQDRTPVHIGEDELPKVERTIADQGRYSAVMAPDEWHRLNKSPDAMNGLFTDLAHRALHGPRSPARTRVDPARRGTAHADGPPARDERRE